MDRCTSQMNLLKNDILDHEPEDVSSDKEDGRSSGYESCDSLTPPPPSSAKTRAPPSGQKEVMLYSNTESLSDSLQYILSMPELCDVTFLVGERRVPVHGVKAILATRSRIFYQMILHHQRKATMSVKPKSFLKRKPKGKVHSSLQIPVPDYDQDVFTSLISFLHSGKVRVQLTTVTGLLCAAVEFGLKDLQKACWDFIRRCHGQGHQDVLLQSAQHYSAKKGAQKMMNALL